MVLFAAVVGFGMPMDAQAQSVRIVALGASNTYGKGVARGEAYPAHLQALLKQKGVNAAVSNAGINGDTTGGMLARLGSAVPAGTQIVILQPGGNDRRQGQEGQRAGNIAKIRSQLAARGVKVIMMENDALRAVPQGERAADGVHFTPRGYAILAQNILPQVLAVVGKSVAGTRQSAGLHDELKNRSVATIRRGSSVLPPNMPVNARLSWGRTLPTVAIVSGGTAATPQLANVRTSSGCS
jgi:acyl-CoA thioesterase-1